MTQRWRLATGGRIDRSRPINFTFNGARHQGYAGDTLAWALLANGIRLVGRSFKYHRRRGVVGGGAEGPVAWVPAGERARRLRTSCDVHGEACSRDCATG